MTSSVLDSAVGAFLDSLRERDLDEPLRAVLRSRGFSHIHFVHGSTELGRDFIARREDPEGWRQYALQSKVGDVGLNTWRAVREQIEDIRTGDLSHPGFDPTLPRVAVLVTTGRLVGDARLSAQTYKERYADEVTFDVWDRDRLIEDVSARPDALLAGADDGPLLRILGEIDGGDVTDGTVEIFSRRWLDGAAGPTAVVEAAVIAARLRRTDRLDLACLTALGLLRAALVALDAAGSDATDVGSSTTADQAVGLFLADAGELWDRCRADADLLRPVPFVNKHPEFGFFATYSVRCTRLAEILALLVLHDEHDDDAPPREDPRDWLRHFVTEQPGCAHPLSDRHAVSLIPVAIALAGDHDVLGGWMRDVVRWTADRYEGALPGLASVHAEPVEQVERLLGGLAHVDRPRRRESYIAAVVLDMATLCGLGDVFDDARNDFLAVGVRPEVLHVTERAGRYRPGGPGLEQEVDPPYVERWADAPNGVTAPHLAATASDEAEDPALSWRRLAVASVLRDRHEPHVIQRMLTAGRHPTDDIVG